MVAMRNISLAFDLEGQKDGKGEYKPARLPEVPDLPAYLSYCIFPGTTVFGPFLTYAEHCKFLHPTPLVCPNMYCMHCNYMYCIYMYTFTCQFIVSVYPLFMMSGMHQYCGRIFHVNIMLQNPVVMLCKLHHHKICIPRMYVNMNVHSRCTKRRSCIIIFLTHSFFT